MSDARRDGERRDSPDFSQRGLIRQLLTRSALWFAGLAALLFISAGSTSWTQGWIFFVESSLLGLAAGLWFARHDPDLLRERMQPLIQRSQPGWDRWFMALFIAIYLASFVAMGLEARYFGTGFPLIVQALGALAILCAYAIVWRALAENSFAAPVVKIQRERGQHIVTTGPYAYVRHPMYAGAPLLFFGAPLLLNSRYGLLFALALTLLLMARSVMEERTLLDAFPDYREYEQRVRWRLVPFIW